MAQITWQIENTASFKRRGPDGGFVNEPQTPLRLRRIYGPLYDPAKYSLSTHISCFDTVNTADDGRFGLFYAAGEQRASAECILNRF